LENVKRKKKKKKKMGPGEGSKKLREEASFHNHQHRGIGPRNLKEEKGLGRFMTVAKKKGSVPVPKSDNIKSGQKGT